jgi:MFS family permease
MAGPAGVAPEVNIGVNTGVAPVEPALGVIELKMPESRLGVAALFAKLLVPDILFTIGEGAVVGLLSVFFFLRFTLQPGPLGILFTLAGLVGGGASLAAPRIVRNWSKLPMATTMQFFTVPALLLTGFSPFLLLSVAGELMRQILRGLFEPVYAAFAMERVSSRYRGTLSGFYSVTWGVGYSIGPITGGLLIKHAGLYGPFVIAAGCIGLSGIMLRLFFGKEEREERFESQHKPAEESH